MEFSEIPTRANGPWILASWFNYLRNAGIVLQNRVSTLVGAGASSSETLVAIANNQTGANVTGLIISPLYRVTRVKYWVRRVATDTVMSAGELTVMYDGTNFFLGREEFETPTTAGMAFDVNISTGQVTYDSSNMAGLYDTVASKIGFTKTTQGTI